MSYSPADHILFVILAVVWPLYAAYVQFPKLKREVSLGVSNTRVRAYARAMAIQWSVAAFAVVLWIGRDRPFYELGIAPSTGWRLGLGAVVLATAAILLEIQRRRVTADPALRVEFREKIANASPLLPTDSGELFVFYMVSVTAGLCEELLYRGFLMWYLAGIAGPAGAVALSSVVFGMAHLYQGRKGVLQTGTIGLVLALLYLGTGSLWVPMALHTLVDMSSGTLWYQVRDADEIRSAPLPADDDKGETDDDA